MSEKTQGARNIAEEAFGNERKFKQLVGALSGPSRRERQNAAAALSFFAKDHPDLMIPFGAAVIDALNRPEAQTRWECLDILTTMVDHDSRTCDKAVPGAETALFDEESGRCVWQPCGSSASWALRRRTVLSVCGLSSTRLSSATMATWSSRICWCRLSTSRRASWHLP